MEFDVLSFFLSSRGNQAAEVISRSGMNISKGVAVPTIDGAKRGLPDAYVTVREVCSGYQWSELVERKGVGNQRTI